MFQGCAGGKTKENMKLNLTALIIAAAFLVFGIWAVGELSRPITPPEEIKINYTIADSTNKVIKEMQLSIDSLKKSQLLLKNKRNEVPKKVALYTDSDVVRFNDSISAVYGIN